MVWDIYVAVAVVVFSVSLATMFLLLGAYWYDEILTKREHRKIGRELKEISNMEETRKYLDQLFNKDRKED